MLIYYNGSNAAAVLVGTLNMVIVLPLIQSVEITIVEGDNSYFK